jgi:hypothetical protein
LTFGHGIIYTIEDDKVRESLLRGGGDGLTGSILVFK